jgi:hypothetical protein
MAPELDGVRADLDVRLFQYLQIISKKTCWAMRLFVAVIAK